MSKILSMTALQGICRESKGTAGVTSVQFMKALISAGSSEESATQASAQFFRDFDTTSQGVLPIKLFLDQYKTMTTVTIVKELLRDTTGQISVTKDQLSAVLNSKMDSEATAIQVTQMFNALDSDASGTISEQELRTWLANATAEMKSAADRNTAAVLQETFARFDTDGSGQLNAEEVRFMLSTLGEVLSDADFKDVMRLLDTDGSGEVSFEEFRNWFLNSERVRGQTGLNAAVIQARLVVGRGNNWLRTMLSKSAAPNAIVAELTTGEFKETRGFLNAAYENSHVTPEIKQWCDEKHLRVYASFDWKMKTQESCDFFKSLLEPYQTLAHEAGLPKEKLYLKISSPDACILRVTIGGRGRGLDEVPIEEMKAMLNGASVTAEMPWDIDYLANHWDTITVGDLAKLRVRVQTGQIPSEMIRQVPQEMHQEMKNALHVDRIPIVSDILEGKAGEIKGDASEIVLNTLNNVCGPLLNELLQKAVADARGGATPPNLSNAKKVAIRAPNGQYLGEDWKLVSQPVYLCAVDSSDRKSLFDTAQAQVNVPPGGVAYRLRHKATGLYAGAPANPWTPLQQPTSVYFHADGASTTSTTSFDVQATYRYYYMKHRATGLYATRGGAHFQLSENRQTVTFQADSQGRNPQYVHIRTNANEFMRHYNGDHDNFTQNYTDSDTAFEMVDRGNGAFTFKNPNADRYLGCYPGNRNLNNPDVCNENSMWELESSEPPRDPCRSVTMQHVATGKYAKFQQGNHWVLTSTPTILKALEAEGHFHFGDGSLYMRHYTGDWDNFEQSSTGSDTQWEVQNLDGGKSYIVNPTRAGRGYLSARENGNLYVPTVGENPNMSLNEWVLRFDVTAADLPPAPPAPMLQHFRHETGVFARHYNGDSDVFTQNGMDGDTRWEISQVGYNEFTFKNPSVDRFLSIRTSDNRLFCPTASECSETDRIWEMTAAEVEVKQATNDTPAPEPVAEYFSVYSRSRSTFMMHHSGSDDMTDQSYIDQDTAMKVVSVEGGVTLMRQGGRMCATENGRIVCVNDRFEVFVLEPEPSVAAGPEKKSDEEDTKALADKSVASIFNKLIDLAKTEREFKSNFILGCTMSNSSFRFIGRDFGELYAIHARRADGNGVSLNLRGLVQPDSVAKLFLKFKAGLN